MKTICLTVTNDLTYDQRMQRISGSLAAAGYVVTLVGRVLKDSRPLSNKPYRQHRIKCFFNKSFLFYTEYNLRLFFFLFFHKKDALCAVDLDTILPVLLVSILQRKKRIYDAHEFFTEMKEVRTRPAVQAFWNLIGRCCVPQFKWAYTVSNGLGKALEKEYKIPFATISNFPLLIPISNEPSGEAYLFFGGAVNEARAFEYLIPAMQHINTKLLIAGDGNFMPQLKALIKKYNVTNKVSLLGMQPPEILRKYAEGATLGVGLAESEGINQYWALPNKFTDYMHAGLPQITMNYPEYVLINKQFNIAVLIDNLEPSFIAQTINTVLADKEQLTVMRAACMKAREVYNWQTEEKKLLLFYEMVFNE